MTDENAMFKKLVELIKEENRKQTEVIQTTLKAEITEIKNEFNNLRANFESTTSRVAFLEETNRNLKQQNELLERKLKKNNIIIFGLAIKENQILITEVVNQLNQLLQININVNQINNVYTIGKQQADKPIVVEFISYITKIEVLKNCKKLKNTGVRISDDLIKQDQEIRKRLLKHQKEARKNNLNSYIRGNKLIINNEVYTINDLEKDQSSIVDEETIQEKRKSSSAPATPLKISNVDVDDDTYDTIEDNEQEDEDELEKVRQIKKRKVVKHRPPTRKFIKETAAQFTKGDTSSKQTGDLKNKT